jgi:hypothetical protein
MNRRLDALTNFSYDGKDVSMTALLLLENNYNRSIPGTTPIPAKRQHSCCLQDTFASHPVPLLPF